MSAIKLVILLLTFFIASAAMAQVDSTYQPVKDFPENSIDAINKKLVEIDKKLSKQTLKALKKFEKQEAKLRKKLAAKDSSSVNNLKESIGKFDQLQKEFANTPDKAIDKLQGEYNAYLDTLRTTFKFLQKGENIAGNSKALKDKLSQATSKLNILEGKFKKAEEIKKYLRERKINLKAQLEKFGMLKQLKKIEKTTYYYAEYIKEYKTILKDRKKMEQKAMSLLYKTSFFKKFAEKNSLLAGLFRTPPTNTVDMSMMPALAGIQTRVGVQQIMQDRVGAGGPNAMMQVRQQIQAGQAELSKLKAKLTKYGSADAEIPSFKPNSQKTKSLFKRLTYEANIQFSNSNKLLPTQSDLAFGVGYKLNDKGIIGIASSLKLGLGTGWNNIKLSTQGVGLRSYIDWKVKGNLYVSGGYEQNYFSQLGNYTQWQKSGLIGMSKKIKLKSNKGAKIQILYDFFSYKHVPTTQPFVFRTGFTLK